MARHRRRQREGPAAGAAKAWVSFVGSTGSIKASYNVSSVTRNSAGYYTINFATAMTDANYVLSGAGQAFADGANSSTVPSFGLSRDATPNTTTSCKVLTGWNGSLIDFIEATFVFFGN